jgi:hypothetical protein
VKQAVMQAFDPVIKLQNNKPALPERYLFFRAI